MRGARLRRRRWGGYGAGSDPVGHRFLQPEQCHSGRPHVTGHLTPDQENLPDRWDACQAAADVAPRMVWALRIRRGSCLMCMCKSRGGKSAARTSTPYGRMTGGPRRSTPVPQLRAERSGPRSHSSSRPGPAVPRWKPRYHPLRDRVQPLRYPALSPVGGCPVICPGSQPALRRRDVRDAHWGCEGLPSYR